MSGEMKDVDIFTITKLLRLRRPLSDEADCDEAVALASHDLASPEEIARASLHLEGCALCRDSVLALAGFDASRNTDARNGVRTDDEKTPRFALSKRRVLFTAAAILVVGLTAVLTISRPWSTVPEEGEGLVVKGPSDRFQIAVQRDAVQFTAKPSDRLLEGDRLGLFYSAKTDGFLAIVDIADDGQTTMLYPSGSSQSAPIAEGESVPIPDGAIVRGGNGCEWVVAIFSDSPLGTAFLKETLGRAIRESRTCELTIEIPGARQVRILPFKR